MRICILLVLFECIFLLVGGGILYANHKNTILCTESTNATVVEMKKEVHRNRGGSGSYGTTWKPVVEYYAGNQFIHQVASTGSNPTKYKVGDRISIKYNPKNPTNFIIEGDNLMSMVGIVFIGVSLMLIVLTLFISRMMFT